jgi:2-methylisocitrate lyase-like PEP mutase family enzyme
MPDRTAFAELHFGDLPLVLPNAWDVPSALELRAAGFPAIGTTSFGVAASRGTPDGERATRKANIALAAALRPLGVLLSFDVEDGYSDDPEQVADYVTRLRVHGVNVEDSTAERLIDPDVHAAKVAAIKAISPNVFVNARVDTYWLGQHATVSETLDRAHRYVAAGADGIFVPGTPDVLAPDVIADLAGALDRPLNVLAIPGQSPAELARLGVRRVSTGSLPYRAALRAAVDAALAVRDGATPPAASSYAAIQASLLHYEDGVSSNG